MNNNDIWKEVWKETEYKGYLVSNYGRVMSKGDTTNRYKHNDDWILNPADNGHGYLFVNIEGKQRYIHRLVAKAFIPNPNNYTEVNHKNHNKNDNCVDNLEWCDGKYNVSYTVSIKIKQIDPNTKEVINIFNSANQAAKSVGGNNVGVLQCCKRIKYNTYKGYIWRFINDNDYKIPFPKRLIVRLGKEHTETIYNSVKEAAKDNKVSVDTIYNYLNRKRKDRNGYVWIERPKIQ